MAWALLASVALVLIVASPGFRRAALYLSLFILIAGGLYIKYDSLSNEYAHSRIAIADLALLWQIFEGPCIFRIPAARIA